MSMNMPDVERNRLRLRVHAIVVTYRRPETLRSTVGSLLSQSRTPDTLWIVDNEPSDDLEHWASALPNTVYCRSPSNLGPAGGIALGMQRVLEIATEDDLVLLIDDDDPPPFPGAVASIVNIFESATGDEKIACAGLVGSRFDRSSGRTRRIPDAELVGLVDVDYVAGNQLPTYRVSCIREVGVFDEDLFFGFDDLEFGLRLRASHWRLVVDGAIMLDLRQRAGRLGLGYRVPGEVLPPWRRYYSSRNIVALAREYGTRGAQFRAFAYAGPGAALRAATWLRSPSSAFAAIRGGLDGLRGRTGRIMVP